MLNVFKINMLGNGNGFISQEINRDERIPVLRIRRHWRATDPEAIRTTVFL